MSTSYIVFIQTLINDEPIAMGPFIPNKEEGYRFVPVLESGYNFSETNDFLKERAHPKNGLPNRLCAELIDEFKFINDEDSLYDKDYYMNTFIQFYNYKDIANLYKKDKPFKYNGYITKETKASYECGEICEIEYWLEIEEYNSLNDNEKCEYTYYEWNSSLDAYSGVCELVNNINALIEAWDNYYGSGWSYSESEQAIENIQVIIYESN